MFQTTQYMIYDDLSIHNGDAPKSQTCCQTFVDSGMTIICAKLVKGVWCVIGFVTLYSLGYKTWLPAKACPNLEQNQLFLSAEQYFFLGLHLPNQRGASFDFHYQLLGGPCTRYSMVVHGQLHGNYIILGFAVVLSRIPKIIRLGSFNHQMKIDRGIRMPKQIHYSSVFITVLITIHHYSLIIAGIKPTHILADLQTLTNLRSCNLVLLPLRSPLATSISLRWVLCCALSQPLTEEVSVSTYPWYLGILSLGIPQ